MRDRPLAACLPPLSAVLAAVLAAVVMVLLAAGPLFAGESAPIRSARATVSLVSDTDAYAPGTPFRLALRFRLAAGWHIYWRNPGDAGAPPELTPTLPEGAQAGPIEWPTPTRIAEGPLMTYGYTGDVVLPFAVTPPRAGGTLPIRVHATWLVCADICVPEAGDFRLDLPSGTPAASAAAPLFAAASQRAPRPSPFPARIAPNGRLYVDAAELSPAHVRAAWFLPDQSGLIRAAAEQTLSFPARGLVLGLTPDAGFRANAPLAGVLVMRDAGGSESFLALSAEPGVAPDSVAPPAWPETLVFAFLGGLILNLMPCVFPVLAMKALALGKLAEAQHRTVIAHVGAYTAGVLAAFAALGGTLLALRAGGAASGWGFQFQSPAFVVAMAWLLFAVGLNLSGVFEVGGAWTGFGQRLAGRSGHFGSFFTGLLAVAVATPCTAPFMGAAIAVALAAPAAVGIGVFLVMGVGLASPYLLLALLPGLARRLPRPGRWMVVLKQALAFPMYGAAAWLVWVVSQEAGSAGVLAAAIGLVLLGFAGWALGLAAEASPRARRAARASALAAVLGALALLPGVTTANAGRDAPLRSGDGAEPFSAARLAALRAEGRTVFVNMTASWCISCLVNERVALSPSAVRAGFRDRHVAYLKGDWTRQNPEITAYLHQFGRDGVPLYVVYRAGAEQPEVLAQILTESAVLAAIGDGAGNAER